MKLLLAPMFKCSEYFYNKTATYLINNYFNLHKKMIFDLFLKEHFDDEYEYDVLDSEILNSIVEQTTLSDVRISVKFNNIKYLARKCKLPNKSQVRNLVLPTKMDKTHDEYWSYGTPQHAKETACFEAYTSYTTSLINYMVRLICKFLGCIRTSSEITIAPFSLAHRENLQNLGIKNRTLKFAKNTFMPTYFADMTYNIDRKEKGRVMNLINGNRSKLSESRLIKDNDSYYLCLVLKTKTKLTTPQYNICAVDPGVRTFQTVYSPDGVVAKLGDCHNQLLVKTCKQIDKYNASKDKIYYPIPQLLTSYQRENTACNRRRRHRLKKRINKTWDSLKNKTEELHKKTAKYLTDNFQTILIPDTNISSMLLSYKRKINKTTVRGLSCLAHYRFRMRLLQLAKRTGNEVIEVSEAYTSKTCGQCGNIDANLGGKKTYTCSCGYTCDRDIHGARNIYLRAISNIWERSSLE